MIYYNKIVCKFNKNLIELNNSHHALYLKNFITKYLFKLKNYIWIIENTSIMLEYDKNITIDLIEKYPYKWYYFHLSYNPNLTEEFILKYPHQNWNIKYLIENNKITDFKALSKFKNINQSILYKYPDKPWDWEWLIQNTDICINEFYCCNTYYSYITEEFILKYPYKNWDIDYLIKINKITDFKSLSKFKIINDYILYYYPDKPWDWEWLIQNIDNRIELDISLNLIEKYYYKWNYKLLSRNPNLTEEFILKYPHQNWDIDYLIENNKITDFIALSKFININEEIINEYPNKPWDWGYIIDKNINLKKIKNINLKKIKNKLIFKKIFYKIN